eukprot:21664_1
MAFDLHTRFTNLQAAPKSYQGLQHKENTIYFIKIGSKQKLKKSEIEDKLALTTFNRLHFYKCDLSKAYKTTFAYLIHNHRKITILEIEVIDGEILSTFTNELIQFISSDSCSNLIKLSIRSNDTDLFDMEQLFTALMQSKSLQQNLQCIQFENMQINPAIKLDKTLSKYIFAASVDTKTLRTLDLRNMKFSGKQNYALAVALTSCLTYNSKKTTGSYSCSINKLFFGGSDQWTQKGVRLMCEFIKFNYNLELLGIELLNSPSDKPFISAADGTAMSVFVTSLDNHPALQRLELYHMQTYTLKVFGSQFEKRIKGDTMRLSELYLQQVHQNTLANPMDHSVFPAILKVTKRIPWLQLLELKISVFCNLFEAKELCKLLPFCKHLNGLSFHCKMGEMFSKKQILGCVNHIVDTFKEMKVKNVSRGRLEIIYALNSNLIIANNGDKNVDKLIPIVILSYADISYAFDAGLLFFESTFLQKLDLVDRIPANEWLLNNWKKLPYNGANMSDDRYRNARDKLIKFNKKVNKKSNSKKSAKKLLINVNKDGKVDDEKHDTVDSKDE